MDASRRPMALLYFFQYTLSVSQEVKPRSPYFGFRGFHIQPIEIAIKANRYRLLRTEKNHHEKSHIICWRILPVCDRLNASTAPSPTPQKQQRRPGELRPHPDEGCMESFSAIRCLPLVAPFGCSSWRDCRCHPSISSLPAAA